MHAHVSVEATPRDLLELRAVVFAASRSLTESARALSRQHDDLLTVWGVGVHPGLAVALDEFDPDTFVGLVERTGYVAEVGLDGKAKAPLPLQQSVFAAILSHLQRNPRITSIHSFAATHEVIEQLQATPIKGSVLHWWLGDSKTTVRALELGAHFSINTANLKNVDALGHIPLDRLLTETDHPDGDRLAPQPRRPGNVTSVETALAKRHGITPVELRRTCWQNLRALTSGTDAIRLLPPRVASILQAH